MTKLADLKIAFDEADKACDDADKAWDKAYDAYQAELIRLKEEVQNDKT